MVGDGTPPLQHLTTAIGGASPQGEASDVRHLEYTTNSFNVGQGLAPAEKGGTSKPVPYNLWHIKRSEQSL